jgi:ferritin-like metal-binding protein YciE
MKTPPLNLSEIFNQTLIEVHAAEKKYSKSFEAMAQTAFTPELGTALSPESLSSDAHASRLQLIIDSQHLKTVRITSTLDDELLKTMKEVSGFTKQKSILKDIQLLHTGKTVLEMKAGSYEVLYLIALELKLTQQASLLEQSYKDLENCISYLKQISQNIIYPAAKASGSE